MEVEMEMGSLEAGSLDVAAAAEAVQTAEASLGEAASAPGAVVDVML